MESGRKFWHTPPIKQKLPVPFSPENSLLCLLCYKLRLTWKRLLLKHVQALNSLSIVEEEIRLDLPSVQLNSTGSTREQDDRVIQRDIS